MTKRIKDTSSIEEIISLVNKGENIFITGGGGVGKSYILGKLKNHYKNDLAITSTTGISALNIDGQTIHSWAGIGIANKPIDQVVSAIRKSPTAYKRIILAEKLAIDEISMLDNLTFEYIDRVLRQVRENNEPFGGIQIILVGDFFQLPPVGLGTIKDKDFCFNSESWNELDLVTILLKKVHRQKDIEYINALNNIRVGKTSVLDLKVFYKRDIPSTLNINDKNLLQIFPTNGSAEAFNLNCFREINEKAYLFIADDYIFKYDKNVNGEKYPFNSKTKNNFSNLEFLQMQNFDKDSKSQRRLELKIGCRVMLLKNIFEKNLANGSCGTVIDFYTKENNEKQVVVKFDNGQTETLGKMDFDYYQNEKIKIKRKQIPLCLAYAITIHKAQGMTFDKLLVNMDRIFDYGQAYVALSRTRTLEGLILRGFNHNLIAANDEVIDFYKQIENSEKCIIVE